MCRHMHSECTQEVMDSCSGITGSASESPSREKKLLQNMQIYLMPYTQAVHQVWMYIRVSVLCSCLSQLFFFCTFELSRVGSVWLLKYSPFFRQQGQMEFKKRSNQWLLSHFSVLLCSFGPYRSLYLLSLAFAVGFWECDLVRSVPKDRYLFIFQYN